MSTKFNIFTQGTVGALCQPPDAMQRRLVLWLHIAIYLLLQLCFVQSLHSLLTSRTKNSALVLARCSALFFIDLIDGNLLISPRKCL